MTAIARHQFPQDGGLRSCVPPQLDAGADGAGRVGAVGVTDGDLPGAGEVAGAGAWLVDGRAGLGDGRSAGEVLGALPVRTEVVGVGTGVGAGVTAGAAAGRTRT